MIRGNNLIAERTLTHKLIFSVTVLFIVVFLIAIPGLAQGPPPNLPPTKTPDFVTGEILVKFRPSIGIVKARDALQVEGLRLLEVSSHSGVMRVQVTPGHEAGAIAKLMARDDVEMAAYNHIFYASIIPDDQFYSAQWALPKIEAPDAWDISTGSRSVVVAVVDSGLDTNHIEFRGRIVDPHDEIDDDDTPQDICGHGTHVTGIAGAKGNNSTGVAGMAWDINILPVRVLTLVGSCKGSEFDVQAGINWAVIHGAKIINLSIGALPTPGQTCEQAFPIMSGAIKDAYDAGVLAIAASGNNFANRLACPALQLETMAVGSTTSSDFRSSFSNYGPNLRVVAPGSSIYSTFPGTYGFNTGTSMATPHVAGLAALLWSLSPDLSRNDVRSIIEMTAKDLGPAGYDLEYGHGRINARRALEALVSLQTSPPKITYYIDDSNDVPVISDIQVISDDPSTISWTATISPAVSWLSLTSGTSGTISTMSSPIGVTIEATRPIIYGLYNATVIISGTNSSGEAFGTRSTQVNLSYSELIRRIYLPSIFKHDTPDLVVESLSVADSGATVVIKNQGNADTTGAFWVDIYFNPSITPSLNQPWPSIASHGLVWGVTTPIMASGGTLTLTIGDAYFHQNFSSPMPLPVGAKVYAFVDSIHPDTTYGAVQESNEGNNLFGPITSTTILKSISATPVRSRFLPTESLPVRETTNRK